MGIRKRILLQLPISTNGYIKPFKPVELKTKPIQP